MFLNVSNHPSDKWSQEQLAAAEMYGSVRDFPFPVISPYWDIARVSALADALFKEISDMHPDAVLCQGEMTMTYQLVKRLQDAKTDHLSVSGLSNSAVFGRAVQSISDLLQIRIQGRIIWIS